MKTNSKYFAAGLWKMAALVLALMAIESGIPSSQALTFQGRELRVANTSAGAGQNVNVSIELISLGNENALGFSLNFNPAVLSNPMVTLGSSANGATLNVNTFQVGSGRIGVAMALPSGQTFAAGTRQLVIVTFTVAATAVAGPTAISFGDLPITRETSDANANVLLTTYTSGTVTIQQPNPEPELTSLNPGSVTAGSGAITLTLNGAGFGPFSSVRWNNAPRSTTFINDLQLRANIPTSDLVVAGIATLTVVNPSPGGGTSNSLSFTINNPSPSITGLNPNSRTAGGTAFTLTVTGTNFVNGSSVQWNGSPRATTFASSTQLTAAITASDIATSGAINVTVLNPAPGGGVSSAAIFTVNQAQNPIPTITGLSPNGVVAGGAAFTLTVNGTNFVNGSTVWWNGIARTTTFVSQVQLTAAIPAADIAVAGLANVTVNNPAPGGGTSSSTTFTISNPLPAISSISPAAIIAGSPAFTLTVNGSGFVNGSTVRWNGGSRVTTFVNSAQLTALIPTADVVTAGTAIVTVINTSPGGGISNSIDFTINTAAPAPAITILSPGFAIAGGDNFLLTVNGSNFTGNSTVQWKGNARTTTFVNPTQLTAQIPATDIATAGVAMITVVTPPPGGGTSNALPFTVANPVASVSAASYFGGEIAPESIAAAFGFDLATASETGNTVPLPTMLAGTKVTVKDSAGIERLSPLFFVAANQVNYQMPPGTVNGPATVTISSSNNTISIGSSLIASVAPGIFTANSNGSGVPAATVFRLKPNGESIDEPISQFDSTLKQYVPIPIDLGPEVEQVFVVLFGTGFRFNSGLSGVSAQIGGVSSEVLFAGPQGDYVGLDQCNIRIPRSLNGRGEVDLVLTVNGKVANTVRINIK